MKMRNQISVLALDLGSNLGWCRCVCTLRPVLHINVVDHGTVYLDTLTTERMRKEYNEVFDRNRVRMMIYKETIHKLIELVKFDCFVVEDVFCNPTRVSAFKSLVRYMEVLENIVNVEKQKRLYTVAPTMIKRHIDNYGHSDKSRVQEAVLNQSAITMKRSSEATEHEYDAIAAAWAFVHEYLMTLV